MSSPLTSIEIDLDAVSFNLRQIRTHIGASVRMMPVVKANAYGHGAVEVAKTALEVGAEWIGVNRVGEGVQLRQAGITAPILVMGYAPTWEMPTVVDFDLTPTITEAEVAQTLSHSAQQAKRQVKVHIKIDTGMGRLGLLPEEAAPFVQAVLKLPALEVEGVFTHFAVADSKQPDDRRYTQAQYAKFLAVLEQLERLGIGVPLRHCANSAGTLYYPEMHLDMVRVGIITYGLRPNANVEPPFPLRPALSIKSHVARVRMLPPGSCISYGRTYTTTQATPVALIPVGYGDGYHRLLSNRGAVLINGRRAPIVGRVCMDQFVVDVSDCGEVNLDDEVVLLGRQGEDEISADEIARWAETINYEVTTALLARAPRVYRRQGKLQQFGN